MLEASAEWLGKSNKTFGLQPQISFIHAFIKNLTKGYLFSIGIWNNLWHNTDMSQIHVFAGI